MSALLTDALRANLLEEKGYETQILEFIDMEHTPKNILIRAVRKNDAASDTPAGGRSARCLAETGVKEMADFPHVRTCLQKLMEQENS